MFRQLIELDVTFDMPTFHGGTDGNQQIKGDV